MLINLVPDFIAAAESADPVAAYGKYYQAHEPLLAAYWRNYVIEPESPQFDDVVQQTVRARRHDLRALLEHVDLLALARFAEQQCRDALDIDVDYDVVLMVGVGAANAGELVVRGRGVAFVCLEHFTGVANPDTHGLGLEPELLPMWIAHEVAHVARYTSPTSRAQLRELVAGAGGNYSYWGTGRDATLRELLVNEGLAVQASRIVSPGHATWEYFGYSRREFSRIRELAATTARAAEPDLDHSGLGLRLRFLSGGMSQAARTFERTVLPERAGYFLGAAMVEAAVAQHGLAWAVRAPSEELIEAATAARSA